MAGNLLEKILTAAGGKRPLLYWPGHGGTSRHGQVAWCEYSGTPTVTGAGESTAASSAFGGVDFADFDGSAEIEFPGFGDLVSDKDHLLVLFWMTPANTTSGTRRIVVLRESGNALIAGTAQVATQASASFRSASGDGGWVAASSTLVADTNELLIANFSPLCEAVTLQVASGTVEKTNANPSSESFTDLDGQSLFIGSGDGADYFQGVIHSVAVFDELALSARAYADLLGADSVGVWCNISLSDSGVFKASGGSALTATGLEFSLRKDGPDGLQVDGGDDLAISAGACSREFYVPAAGDYYLTVRDPATNTTRHGLVPLVAA